MSISFVKNTGIKLVFNNKHIPKNLDKKSSSENDQKSVQFSQHEYELLKKIDKLENVTDEKHEEEDKQIQNTKKKEKFTEFTLPEIKNLKAKLGDTKFLCDFIDVSALHLKLPENEIVPRNPELEKRIQRLKAEQEQRKYESMTKNVDSTRQNKPEDTIAFQMKQINRQLIAVAQFIFSVLSGFLFGFLGVELLVGNLDFGFRLLLGIICALTIALAEIYFLAKQLVSDDDYIDSPTKTTTYYKDDGQGKLKTN